MDRISQLIEFLSKNPTDPFLRHALAMEYIGTNRDKEARPLLEANLEGVPPYIGSFYPLGKLYERSGEREHALLTFHHGMELAASAGETRTAGELKTAWEQLSS